MRLSPNDWHERFRQQALWTRDLRAYLYQRTGMENVRRVLEVGCGTGVILIDFHATAAESGQPGERSSSPSTFGIDIETTHLNLAMRNSSQTRLTQGDAHQLPYPEASFDLTLCHYLLLWVDQPVQVICEMARVTRPGGAVLALAEPDYGGRIDYPDELSQLGIYQKVSLRQQGADPLIGRKLKGIFQQAGLQSVETGLLGGQWSGPPDWDAWDSEWAVLEADLKQASEISKISEAKYLKALDRSSYQRGERILFVPTFYAWGKAGSTAT